MKSKNKWLTGLLALSLSLPVSLPYLTPIASAEGPSDPAPVLTAKITNQNAGKKILFDNIHGQTAGAADWVINGGFSDFGNGLANNGFYVKELRKSTPLTYSDLSSYDVFVIPEANIPFKTSEQAALLQYVQNGGSVFFISDHYNADRNKNRWDASEVFNGYRRGAWTNPAKGMTVEEANSTAMQGVSSSDWLGSNFGVRFRYNAIGDVTANQIVPSSQAFGITNGVSTAAMHAGSTVAILDPKKAKGIVYLPATTAKWNSAVDQGVYNGEGVPEGPFAAVSKVGAGKAAFIGDSSPVEDATPRYVREETGGTKTTHDGYKEQNDATLLVNIVNWLAKKESYTSLDQVSGLQLDKPTSLLSFETPSQSTEPKAEPWSAPAAGYKWYDPATFKPGSYGAVSKTSTPPAPAPATGYSFDHQSVLPSAQAFEIRVKIDGQAPNTTYSGYNIGIYTSSGTQIAKVQNANGSWPSAYGYSPSFSMTTDSMGHAEKVLKVQIQPGTTGAGSLRLRQNTTAKYTESVSIGNVPAEPLQ
ncbi:DNA-binding protein [Aneurinibacillus tyrosinisolvens]|uniref:DNA-binding protein n=1 Tax=Aneurinibacillus tyrosinisolvens TaxID=1443435 RepID=UPI00063F405A|nr:DNA-binding protein [Aneurinibacillus tyrosinisolvens]